ncbi:MAG: AraC family transcriptional regulator [Clostridia bacterium]|nr:AraC family transcriptional regulator [Clostridia bacterium]
MKRYENLKHGTEEFPVGIHNTLCKDGFSLYPHIHREFEFLVMKKGKGVLYIENEKFNLKEGEGVFINSEELHIGIKTDGGEAEFFAVVFAPEVFGSSRVDAVVQNYVEPVLKKKIRPARRLEKGAVELLYKINEKPGELMIKSHLYALWDMCLTGAEKTTGTVKDKGVNEIKAVMAYIRENFDKNIALEDMAGHVNISRGYLCREFKRVLHMTPFEYLIQIRIDKGCEMLKDEEWSIGEIAQRCGFNSFSYFTKIFGEKVGCSPKEYRQKYV